MLGVKRLMDVVLGPSFTKEIFYYGAPVQRRGGQGPWALINRVVPDAELESFVKKYAETIAGNAPLTIQGAART
jgi:enoyl-CoA hydratase/carnithine racemase